MIGSSAPWTRPHRRPLRFDFAGSAATGARPAAEPLLTLDSGSSLEKQLSQGPCAAEPECVAAERDAAHTLLPGKSSPPAPPQPSEAPPPSPWTPPLHSPADQRIRISFTGHVRVNIHNMTPVKRTLSSYKHVIYYIRG